MGEAGEGDRPQGPGRVLAAWALMVAVLPLAACSGGSTRGAPAPSAAELLGRARRFVARATSSTYQGSLDADVDRTIAGMIDRPDVRVRFRARVAGESDAAARNRVVLATSGGGLVEVMRADGVTYSRAAHTEPGLQHMQWSRDVPDIAYFEPSPLDQPLDLLVVLQNARATTVVSRGKASDTVHLTMTGIGDFTRPSPEGTFTDIHADLSVAADGRPIRLRLVAVTMNGRVAYDLTYGGWNTAPAITVPRRGQVAGDLAFDAIAAYHDAPVLQPAALPVGWTLVLAGVDPADRAFTRCAEVGLVYGDETKPNGPELYLYEAPARCAQSRPENAAPFVAGPYRGWTRTTPDTGTTVELVVGPTLVEVDTFTSDFNPAVLVRVLERLVPFDAAHPPAATLPPVPG